MKSPTFFRRARAPFWVALCLQLTMGCVPDDQTNIKPEHLSIANPVPVSADGTVERFRKNNEEHKILLAVFDTGVDYNHPYLRDHIHFSLDAQGKPNGAGKDYLALDDWGSPRIIETSSYEFDFLSVKQKKKALDRYKTREIYNDSVRRTKMGRVCATEQLIKLEPKLEKYIQPYREISLENSETKHGTHVAGLMSYDNPAIGLIPYKVLPYHETDEDEVQFASGKADRFVTNFESALIHARAAGVKVVNLSLGGSFERPTNSNDSAYEEKLEKYNNYKRMLTHGLTDLVKKYNEILFVAAAGNDSGWSDNESRIQYPCGVEAPNVLCVGALNKDGTLARFTNLPLNKVDLVLASGVSLISTVPSDNCGYLRKQFGSILTGGSDDSGLCKYDLKEKKWLPDSEFAEQYKTLISTIYASCMREKAMFEPMSGTSMATPVVSHLAADLWLKSPTATPAEIIAALKSRSKMDNSRQFVAYSLKAKAPSWYKLFKTADGKDEGVGGDENFQAVGLLPRIPGLLNDSVVSVGRADGQRQNYIEFKVGNYENI